VREEITNAAIAIRTAPVKRISYQKFANNYLGKEAKEHFLANVPLTQKDMIFDFDRAVFEKKIGFRAFEMEDEVFIAAPFGAIGESVIIDGAKLSYQGSIEKESLRAKRKRG